MLKMALPALVTQWLCREVLGKSLLTKCAKPEGFAGSRKPFLSFFMHQWFVSGFERNREARSLWGQSIRSYWFPFFFLRRRVGKRLKRLLHYLLRISASPIPSCPTRQGQRGPAELLDADRVLWEVPCISAVSLLRFPLEQGEAQDPLAVGLRVGGQTP